MKKVRNIFLLSLMTLAVANVGYSSEEPAEQNQATTISEKHIFGHDEMVILPELGNLEVHAKLDTGAKTASLSAQDLKIFTKNHRKWARFHLEGSNKVYEFPIKRMAKIKKREGDMDGSDDSTYTERPVIKLQVCLGNQLKAIEVNLADRSRFNYQLLIGKIGLIKLKAIVDPSASKLSTPNCKKS